MRFPMLVLATAIAALACEKGAPLSNSTANLEPAPAAALVAATPGIVTSRAVTSGAATSGAATSKAAMPVTATAQAGTEVKAGATAPAPSGVTRATLGASSVIQPQPSAASEEGNGEPMDDVDDEEVSATDKSGADAVIHEEASDDTPSGPVDDSEGADIELRE